MSSIQHYSPYDHLPRAFTTREIMDAVKRRPQSAPRRRAGSWEGVKTVLAFFAMAYAACLLYWPIARGLAWGLLFVCKICGRLDAELPPYTPYPPV